MTYVLLSRPDCVVRVTPLALHAWMDGCNLNITDDTVSLNGLWFGFLQNSI